MNTSKIMSEFAALQRKNSNQSLDDDQRQRFDDLRQALLLASRSLPVTLRPSEATGPRMRIKDGRDVRELPIDRLDVGEIEVELESPPDPGDRSVVAIVPGPGVPAFVGITRNLGPAQRGCGWYRLRFE
jgi:hypothetical protein